MFDLAQFQNFVFEQNLLFMLPEVILAAGLLVIFALTMVTYKKTREENYALMVTALSVIILSLSSLLWNFKGFLGEQPQVAMFGSMIVDHFAYLMRVLLLLGAGITVAISHRFLEQNTRIVGDFYALVIGATLGGMFLASASDLILVFVALETLSITSYILAGYLRRTARSAEASLKYLIYGGMGTAVFLFGASLIYGLAGSTNFADIGFALNQLGPTGHPTLVVLLLMVLATLAFKLSAAPFHMWTPDVYEGAPTPVSAFLSVVSKTAAMAVTLRMLLLLFPAFFAQWTVLLGIFAVLSMTIGNFVALKQRNVKRLLAYSTIAHAGYMLLGLVIGSVSGASSLVYYLITYLFMNLGAFAAVIYFNTLTRTDDIEAYRGLVHRRPGLTLGFSFCLLSLAGLPITAGFFAKFFLFQALIAGGSPFVWLIIIAMLNSAVSLAYYVNLIRLMVVKEPSSAVQNISDRQTIPAALTTSLGLSVVATLLLGIFATPFYNMSQLAIMQLVQEQQMLRGPQAVSQMPVQPQ